MPLRMYQRVVCSLSGLVLLSLQANAVALAQTAGAPASSQAQAPTPATMAEYQRLLWEYQIARQPFDELNARYWNLVREKRSARNAKRAAHKQIVLDDYARTKERVILQRWQSEYPGRLSVESVPLEKGAALVTLD